MRLLNIILFLCVSFNSYSQWTENLNITFYENNNILQNGLCGGLNTSQISSIDLNQNNIKDIIAFDRSNGKLYPFVNLGINDSINYQYKPEYRKFFPNIHNWILMRDYNCDGLMDIFTYNQASMSVYKNNSINSLSFILEEDVVETLYGSNSLNLFVSDVDIPAIDDIDGDGDLDVLTFNILGGYIEYHKNLSIEMYGHCDSLIFERFDECWGDVYEGFNSYTLYSCNTFLMTEHKAHVGSSLMTLDIDNDNDKELILGDVAFNNLNLLINGGDQDSAIIIDVDSLFPQNNINSEAAIMSSFPASFYLDINNDNKKDLIVSPNNANNAENKNSTWIYLNKGLTNMPEFEMPQYNFLQSDMLDFGSESYPVFFDYNTDGLIDIVCGNFGYFDQGNYISGLHLLKNTGTATNPEFTIIENDWNSISTIPLNTILNLPAPGIIPTFGDIDNDNEHEMIIGDANGKIHLFESTINSGEYIFNITNPNYFNIDVGNNASPHICDLNNDSLLDLLIGNRDGTIYYCPNRGTLNNPIFDTIISEFGEINVSANSLPNGKSKPFLLKSDNNNDGDFTDTQDSIFIFVGSASGNIYKYHVNDPFINNPNDSIPLITDNLGKIFEGFNSFISAYDINNDNQYEIIIGNKSGGLNIHKEDSSITNNTYYLNEKINIYPNPAKNNFTIKTNTNYDYKIFNINGKILENKTNNRGTVQVNCSKFRSGIYILVIKTKNYTVNKKIIIE